MRTVNTDEREQAGGGVQRQPVVSVVIAARNAERFVGDALESVRRQTLADWELVVVDDGSTDRTVAEVMRSGDLRVCLLRQPHRGVARARNAGLAASSGRYVLFLDADDRVRRRTLERLCDALEARRAAVVAYVSYVKIDEHGRVRGSNRSFRLRRRPSGLVLDRMLAGCLIKTPGAALVRREALERVGPFNADLRAGEDWDLWCRLATVGEFVHVRGPEALVEYRLHSGATTRRVQLSSYRQAIEHVFGNAAIKAAVRPSALARLRRRQVAFVCTFLAIQRLREGEPRRARPYLRRAIIVHRAAASAYLLLALTRLPRLPRPIASRVGVWSHS